MSLLLYATSSPKLNPSEARLTLPRGGGALSLHTYPQTENLERQQNRLQSKPSGNLKKFHVTKAQPALHRQTIPRQPSPIVQIKPSNYLLALRQLRLIASPRGHGGSVTIHQDARLYAALLDGTDTVTHTLATGRKAWVHVARGTVTVNGQALADGDGAHISNDSSIAFTNASNAEVLLFDLK